MLPPLRGLMEITWFNALWVPGLLSIPVVAILALRRRIPHAMGIDTSAAAPISRPLGSIPVSGLCGLQVHRKRSRSGVLPLDPLAA